MRSFGADAACIYMASDVTVAGAQSVHCTVLRWAINTKPISFYHNRVTVSTFKKGRKALMLFSYTGSFMLKTLEGDCILESCAVWSQDLAGSRILKHKRALCRVVRTPFRGPRTQWNVWFNMQRSRWVPLKPLQLTRGVFFPGPLLHTDPVQKLAPRVAAASILALRG